MRDSISRKAVLLAIIVAAPPVLALYIYAGSAVVRMASLIAAIGFVLAAWLFAQSLIRRINALTMFVDRLVDQRAPRGRLNAANDELGELARSLFRVAPQIDELFNRLTTELARREAILASMTEGVLAVDARLNVTFCNQAFLSAIGDHAAVEGLPLLKILRDPHLFQILKRVVDSGETVTQRLQLPTAQARTFDVHAVPLAGTNSRGAIAILHDITPTERLERVKRDFIANVSHEIRTPLATIRGYAETLLDGGLEDSQNRRKFVEIIQANGVRLNNIAADLLTLSELETGRPEAQPGVVPLGEVITSAIRAVEPAASLMGVRILAGPIPVLWVSGHRLRLEQAFLNLLDNAVKFNKSGGEVEISVCDQGDGQIRIRISDTGIGIPPADFSRIFERFYRVDKARSRQVGGTGLGLSIVKHAIEQVHGTVSVESQLGQGTTFTVTLPNCKIGLATP
ncbi:MAG TPA: ATP-binding protein [Bryobacteraceae bacterium]|nr:ATP-binding protein [Bryobacteraceae bacterium]